MKSLLLAVILIFVTHISVASATSIVIDCPIFGGNVSEHYKNASAIVVATAIAVSNKRVPGHRMMRRTIMWRVNESWKGPYKGSTFTTRDMLSCNLDRWECRKHDEWQITQGKSMLLFLSGKEPYEVGSKGCPASGYLEESIPQLEKLFELRRSWQQ